MVGRDLSPSGNPFGEEIEGARQDLEEIAGLVSGGAIVEGPVAARRGSRLVGEGALTDLGDVLLEEFPTSRRREHGDGQRAAGYKDGAL